MGKLDSPCSEVFSCAMAYARQTSIEKEIQKSCIEISMRTEEEDKQTAISFAVPDLRRKLRSPRKLVGNQPKHPNCTTVTSSTLVAMVDILLGVLR